MNWIRTENEEHHVKFAAVTNIFYTVQRNFFGLRINKPDFKHYSHCVAMVSQQTTLPWLILTSLQQLFKLSS